MAIGIETVALTLPLVASNAVFSYRRAKKGINAMDKNPLYGFMNMDIAAGQVLKGSQVASSLNPVLEETASTTGSIFKNLAESSKFFKVAGKVVDFTADHINPIICVAGGLKVLGSDDKLDTAAREALSLSTMFAAEGAAKAILGMPYIVKEGGKRITKFRPGLYQNSSLLKDLADSLNYICKEKKLFNKISLSGAPALLKGLAFVCASIAGYSLGQAICNKILGTQKSNKTTAQKLQPAAI